MQNDNTFKGFQLPRTRGTQAPTQSRIICYYFHTEIFNMYDVPPWGIVLPAESGETRLITFFLEADTLGLPAGTQLGMRWTPESGTHTHLVIHSLTGNDTSNVQLRLEDPWLLEAEGQRVLIEHEITLLDGSVIVGEPITVQVAARLVFGGAALEDLQPGDVIDPDRYPDGIRVTYQPISNIRDYHTVYMGWSVYGVRGATHEIVAEVYFSLPGNPGQGYQFRVPPQFYTGLDDPTYERMYCQTFADVKLVPQPNPEFGYGYGALQFHLLQNSKDR